MTRICNILVVEDDEAVQALLGDVLDYAGYLFTLTSNGDEMRAALDTAAFDVAIIDITLQGEDGFALAEYAQSKGCGILLTTGDHQQIERIEASGHRHLFKPFRIEELTALVDLILTDTAALCMARPKPDQPSAIAGA
jgi:DNA-binding response OmpR family regulator